MDIKTVCDLKLYIPTQNSEELSINKSTTIRREPNLKIQHRIATPVKGDRKDIWKTRPETPHTLKTFPLSPLVNNDENQNHIQHYDNDEEMTGKRYKQKLRATLSLDIDNKSPFSMTTKPRCKSINTAIRREPNYKLIERQPTPLFFEENDPFALKPSAIHKTYNIEPLPAREKTQLTPTSAPKTTSHPTTPTTPESEKKLRSKSLTVYIPAPDENKETVHPHHKLMQRTISDTYIRREKNLKVLHRVPTPVTTLTKNMLDLRPSTPSTVPTIHINQTLVGVQQSADGDEEDSGIEMKTDIEFVDDGCHSDDCSEKKTGIVLVNDDGCHSDGCLGIKTKAPNHRGCKKPDKRLMVDISKLYQENKPMNQFVRRETNLKVLHRQDTPCVTYYGEHLGDVSKSTCGSDVNP